jgi:HAMP domain-containing protein
VTHYARFAAAHRTIAAIGDPAWHRCQQDLDAIAPTMREVIARMMDARPSALGAASYDGPVVTGGAASSSTERLALTPTPMLTDLGQLVRAIAALDQAARMVDHPAAVAHASKHAAILWRLCQVWKPHAPTDRDRRAVEQENTVVDPGCEHHARLHIYEPVYRTGNPGGNMPHPMALCEACYFQVLRKGKLPTGDWIEARRRTGKAERIRVVPGA